MTARRGTSNSDDRGSAEARRKRKQWLFEVWAADVDAPTPETNAQPKTEAEAEVWFYLESVPKGQGLPAVRCFRCGKLCTWETVEIDRIKPGCEGGKYTRDNIRPICPRDNHILGEQAKKRKAERRARRAEQQRAYRARKKAAGS